MKLKCIRKDGNADGQQVCRYHTKKRMAREARFEEAVTTEAQALLNE